MLRIGVVAALVGGGLAIAATPALAEAPTVTITRLSSTTLNAGQSAELRYQINNNNQGGIGGNSRQVDIRVNISGNGLNCSGACGSRETISDQDSFNATLRASNNLPPGANQTVTVSITATNNNNETSQPATVQITVRGPDAPQTVKSISGRVINAANSRGVSDATVALQDSSDHKYTTTTDNDGDFKFTSSDSKPITPGEILIAAGKEGFQNNQSSTNVAAGQAKSGVRLSLRSTASPTASATAASPTAEESAADALPDDAASSEESIDPAAAGNNSDSGGGLFSWVLIILGGLLVALGVGAIVLLMIRRKDGGEDDTGDPLPGPNGPRPTPGAHGVFRGGPDPTMVSGGAAMGGNPTMAMRPGLADAPTMMHQPVDEYPDPYGTPLRAPQPTSGPPPGYGYQGANQGGYGPGSSPTAPMAPNSPGAPTAYGSASPTGYGSAAAPTGYGAAGRAPAGANPPDPYAPRDYAPPGPQGGYGYDEPTGRYDRNGGYGPPDQREPRPPAGPGPGGYDADRGYGQSANGYDGGYGAGPSDGYGRQDGGYAPGADGGYEPAPPDGGYHGGGRYQEPPASGYGPQGGYQGYGQKQGGYPPYEQGGYDQHQGYDRTPEPRSGGHDQSQRGYDQGYYDEPTTRGDRQSRRSLDWLDD